MRLFAASLAFAIAAAARIYIDTDSGYFADDGVALTIVHQADDTGAQPGTIVGPSGAAPGPGPRPRSRGIPEGGSTNPSSMITGTGPFASAGVVRFSRTSTFTSGFDELSTWPVTFLVITTTSGRLLFHQSFAEVTFLPLFITSGSGSFGYGLAFDSS